ncbi:MAG: molecular chaperone TorD family protein [Nitrospirae bacterium]|nr:molecular chaperone TorD family protein [Nitrospirota bacterium]
MIETAKQRSSIYGFLALIYRSEITKTLLIKIKDPALLSLLGVNLESDFLHRPEDELLEEHAVEYTRLFIGPGKHISPHESVHHERGDGDWGSLWGKATVEVKKFIEATGLEYAPDFTGMPDHISVELELMQRVTAGEAQARKENDIDKVDYCLQIENKFMDAHLLKWVPAFCDKVVSQAELSFYREMAHVTKQFMKFEEEEIKKYISEAGKTKTAC